MTTTRPSTIRNGVTLALLAGLALHWPTAAEPATELGLASADVRKRAPTPASTAVPQAPPPAGVAAAPPRNFGKVDFVVEDVSVRAVHSPINTGSTIFIRLAVANRGQIAAASSTCRVTLRYTKTNGQPGVANVTNLAVPRLGPGGTFSREPDTFLPHDLQPGSVEASVMMDPEYAFPEGDESNNDRSTTFTVAGPDLRVTGMSVEPGSARPGEEVFLTFTFPNTGPVAASIAPFHVKLSSSRRMDTDVRVLLEGDTGAVRPPATSTTFRRPIRIPADWRTRGPHYLQVVVDPGNAVREENEHNNASDPLLVDIRN
ncbi:MAG: CARDB domain-containing protein [Acidobacteriota bacterium]